MVGRAALMLFDALAEAALEKISCFNVQDIANTAGNFARFGRAAFRPCQRLLRRRSAALTRRTLPTPLGILRWPASGLDAPIIGGGEVVKAQDKYTKRIRTG